MLKYTIPLVIALLFPGVAQAQSETKRPEFPNFALGYWKLEGGGSPTYVIEAELLKDSGSYRVHIAREKPCDFDVVAGQNAGEFRYILKSDGGECKNGVFTLSPRSDGQLNFNWSRPGASGTNTLGPDIEKMRAYRQAAGLSKPVLETAQIEGEWAGELFIGGIGGRVEVSLAATAEGAKLEQKGLTFRCKTMIHPTSSDGTFDTFVYESSSCSDSKVSLTSIGDELEMTVATTGKSAVLRRVSGPVGADALASAPIAFRKVALGMSLADIDGAIEGKPGTSIERFLPDDLQAGTFMGGANLPYLAANYRSIHYPLVHDRYPPDLDEDNIAAYAIGGRVAAIFRVYTPVHETAPSMAAFDDALLGAYGEPSIESGQGASRELQWHYGMDGRLLSGQEARAICVAKGRVDHSNARRIGMRYQWYEQLLTLSVHRQNKVPSFTLRPVHGCGTSLTFVLTNRDDGSVREVQSVAFVHRPVASAIWEARRPKIEAEIRERIQLQANRDTIAPKL